jgi:Zn-dependent peptidase ImmA (M78 family)
MDEATRQEIRRVAARTLHDAGLGEPPLPVEALLEHLRLYRDYYDLEDPGFIDRAKFKLQIHGRKLVDILNKVRLKAVLLFDENRICIDEAMPKIKQPWASCHEAGHRILPWHKPYFYADTAETLDPAWQEELEQEAHYAAARLLFLGDCFQADARDTPPTIAGLKALAKRYGTSLTATLRRYVADGPDLVMAMLVSTPPWAPQPDDQPHRWRHFVAALRFVACFRR